MATRITFKKEVCKGCELCTLWCPKKLIAPDTTYLNKSGIHPMAVERTEECVGCGSCALMCPDAVITIEKVEG